MATIDILPKHAGPATHVLIIGAGEYRHLADGPQPNAEPWGLGQLPGAAVSARHFLDWMRTRFHNPDAPLGSIEHLITGAEGAGLGSEEPTMAGIRAAFNRWNGRASAHAGNIAIFYFAGHGVLKGTDTGLLATDFAQPGNANVMLEAIHVEETVQGMLSCRADQQCFIIDACRTSEEPLLKKMTRPGISLATADDKDVRPIPQPVIFASGLNQASHQIAGAPSPFTHALIESLEAMGVDDVNGGYAPGECVVDTASLLRGIKAALELERRRRPFLKEQDARLGGGGSFVLHHPNHPIRVPFIVGCDPVGLNQQATLRIRQNGAELHQRGPDIADLEFPVTPDSYEAIAELPASRMARKKVLVTPPYREGRLRDFAPVPPTGP